MKIFHVLNMVVPPMAHFLENRIQPIGYYRYGSGYSKLAAPVLNPPTPEEVGITKATRFQGNWILHE